MTTRRRCLRALLWSLVATFACYVDETSTLEINVRAEPGQVSTAFPAQVLVGFDSAGSGYVVFLVGFLCGPQSAPFVTTARFSDPIPDGDATTVDAWLVPLDPGAPVACGPLGAPRAVPFPPGPSDGSRTTADVQVLVACGAGQVRSATIELGRSP